MGAFTIFAQHIKKDKVILNDIYKIILNDPNLETMRYSTLRSIINSLREYGLMTHEGNNIAQVLFITPLGFDYLEGRVDASKFKKTLFLKGSGRPKKTYGVEHATNDI